MSFRSGRKPKTATPLGSKIPPAVPVSRPRGRSIEVRPRNEASNLSLGASKSSSEEPENWMWLLTLVLPLWVVYVSNQWSRSSIYYLVNFSGDGDSFASMNVDLNFTQAQYGLLASIAFTSLFAIASLGAGVASDRYNRKVLTLFSVAAWSAATLGTGLSSSYDQVLVWRIVMGLACAFSTPTAYTLISEKVPKNRAAFAASLYGTGVALGGGLASLSLLLDTRFGWRDTLFAIATFGLASTVLSGILLPNDPKEATVELTVRDSPAVEENASILEEVGEVISTSRVKWLFLASFLRFSSGLSIGVWSAPFFRMEYADRVADYAVAQALITAVCGISSGLLGGFAADWLASSVGDDNPDKVGVKLWVPVVGCVLATPAFYYSIHSGGSFETAMSCLALEYLIAECWFGPTINVLQTTVGPKIGGTAQGLFTLTGAIGNLTPSLLGFLYGEATGVESNAELADLLTLFVCGCYIASAACFALSAQSTPSDKEILAAAKAK